MPFYSHRRNHESRGSGKIDGAEKRKSRKKGHVTTATGWGKKSNEKGRGSSSCFYLKAKKALYSASLAEWRSITYSTNSCGQKTNNKIGKKRGGIPSRTERQRKSIIIEAKSADWGTEWMRRRASSPISASFFRRRDLWKKLEKHRRRGKGKKWDEGKPETMTWGWGRKRMLNPLLRRLLSRRGNRGGGKNSVRQNFNRI